MVLTRNRLFLLALLVIGANIGGTLTIPTGSSVIPTFNTSPRCGYQACPDVKPNMLNVHLVAHTHDDVGWLKTVDQYYYGSRSNIQKAGVQYILDSVVQELLKNSTRRFIFVESAFMQKWYEEQTPEMQLTVKMLVDEGRLEFIGGAWSMNDEAAVHYQSVVDQFTWGLRFLNDTFGECGRPKAGWQIDPFGHSREQGSLFRQMGFDGLFQGRLDFQDKAERIAKQTMEMLWKTSGSLAGSELFTSALYYIYAPPPGFCFDVLCTDDPIIDGAHSRDNNVREKIDLFLDTVHNVSKAYRSNNIILTMGEDFHYQDANMWFKNLDKLIKYTNARQTEGSLVNVFYSTPSCYLKAVHDANIEWPTKSDDFMPYASDPNAFWTGYYTSRPTQKRYEREGNHFLQVCKQLSAIAPTKESYYEDHLTALRDAMGVMQHHDAITGTEKQHVADDYARMLYNAFEACNVNTRSALNQLAGERDNFQFEWNYCKNQNISACDITEGADNTVVLLYNPLGYSSDSFVRLPVPEGSYLVRNDRGQTVASTLIPIPASVIDLPFRDSSATHELVFHAEQIAPVGYKSYFVSKEASSVSSNAPAAIRHEEDNISIGNEHLSVLFDANGFMSSIVIDGETHSLKQNFFWYQGAYGNNEEFRNRSSGAYIFRPNGTEKAITETVKVQVVKTDLVQEVHQVFNEWISQVIRVYPGKENVELEWLVGPIPIDDGTGKEIISRFDSDIASDGVFWTDSNGREMLRRVRNKRETWELELQEPVAGNYYPVTAKIAIEDEHYRLAVLNDRAQGGSSLQDGQLELMVHRRLLRDDRFGVGEALNETQFGSGLVARGKHWLIFGKSSAVTVKGETQQAKERFLQRNVHLPSWVFLTNANGLSFKDFVAQSNNNFSFLSRPLPTNVHLLTMEPWKDGSVLIRFEHIFEKNEDPLLSAGAQFDIADLFQGYQIVSVRETTLAGNQWMDDVQRLVYGGRKTKQIGTNGTEKSHQTPYQIVLNPMQIRTYVVRMVKA